MRRFLDSVSINDVKVEGLDIRNNTVARSVFFKAAIDFSRAELKKGGIELFTLGSYETLFSFCNERLTNWLGDETLYDNDALFILLHCDIESQARLLAAAKRKQSLG